MLPGTLFCFSLLQDQPLSLVVLDCTDGSVLKACYVYKYHCWVSNGRSRFWFDINKNTKQDMASNKQLLSACRKWLWNRRKKRWWWWCWSVVAGLRKDLTYCKNMVYYGFRPGKICIYIHIYISLCFSLQEHFRQRDSRRTIQARSLFRQSRGRVNKMPAGNDQKRSLYSLWTTLFE